MTIDSPKHEQIPALRALWKEAFEDPDAYVDRFFSTAFAQDRCRCLWQDGKVTAALYWFDCVYQNRPLAYLYAIATAKAGRGQGLCHKLMENTHKQLTHLGYAGAILVPENAFLFRLYEHMGYHTSIPIHTFSCRAAGTALPITEINKEEYIALRREFLPKRGVLQEKENIAFLQTQAAFYKGNGFLLTTDRTETSLVGIELLGNTDTAPGIVKALGYTEGLFRTPGGTTPFALYRPLSDTALSPPAYFGLAFD